MVFGVSAVEGYERRSNWSGGHSGRLVPPTSGRCEGLTQGKCMKQSVPTDPVVGLFRRWFLRVLGLVAGLASIAAVAGNVGVAEFHRAPAIELSGGFAGSEVHLNWRTYNMTQRVAVILRDGRPVAQTPNTWIRLGVPDWNVHRYTVKSHQYVSRLDYPVQATVSVGPGAAWLPVPQPVYPLQADVVPRTIRLRVDRIPGVTRYRFEVWNAANGRLVKSGDSATGVYQLNLPANGTFRWRAAAVSMDGSRVAAVGRFSPLIQFTTRR